MSPLLQWSLAIIAGGGVAAAVQTGTVLVRGVSTASTAGLGNFVISSGELAASAGTTVLALILPALCAAAVLLLIVLMLSWFARRRAVTAAKPAC
jgi:hypothetical protein